MSLFVQFLLGYLFTFLIGYKLGQHNKVKGGLKYETRRKI